jgi:formylglycine-generating enzyme required for sulfatase activity
MSEIFLSYKKEEKAIARIYAGALAQHGFSVWWDPDIDHGDIFDKVIQEHLDAAKCVMVLWSKESVRSDWVRAEATEGKSRLVPVLIEDARIPVPFNMIQTAHLIGWKGDQTDPEFLKLLESISKKLGRKKEPGRIPEKYTNSTGMKFALIPAGEFMMGSPENEKGCRDNESPVHNVKILKPFYLGIYPVTQQEWTAVMKNNPSSSKGNNLPVEQVSWNDAQEYVSKLNEKEGSEKYRLPSEAEWEYAARAGTTTRYSFGDDDSKLDEYAWYADNSGSRPPQKGDYYGYDKKDWLDNKWNGKTHPVGQKKPNTWGLYDMHGNVWEWVQDKWHDDYKDAPLDGSSWESGDGFFRVFRGGGWYYFARCCRSAARGDCVPGFRGDSLGFRLVRIL